MAQNGSDGDNVVNLQKHRSQALRRKRARQGASGRGPEKPPSGPGWFAYLQFVLFLGLLAYFVSLCS